MGRDQLLTLTFEGRYEQKETKIRTNKEEGTESMEQGDIRKEEGAPAALAQVRCLWQLRPRMWSQDGALEKIRSQHVTNLVPLLQGTTFPIHTIYAVTVWYWPPLLLCFVPFPLIF